MVITVFCLLFFSPNGVCEPNMYVGLVYILQELTGKVIATVDLAIIKPTL